jgi:hypothetical protein
MKTQVVIPIGVAAEGTPVQKFFEEGIESLLSQTEKVDIWIAADENVPDRIKDFIKKQDLKVKWFEPHSFFRKGSIWKKIFDTWKEGDSEFVAFMHYDDVWDSMKHEMQLEHIQKENLNGSWSEVYVINDQSMAITGDCAGITEFNYSTVGRRHTAFAHSCVVNKEELFNSGIDECENEWTGNFEDVWAIFLAKIGNMKKTSGAKFFWRNHAHNITNSHGEPGHEAHYVKEQRDICNYQLKDVMDDVNSLNNILKRAYDHAINNLSR